MRKDGLEVVKFANQINNTELYAVTHSTRFSGTRSRSPVIVVY